MKFQILDEVFDIDFLDADEMERIEKIVDDLQKRNSAEQYKGMTQSQAIRAQCRIIFDCLDGILGDGAGKRIFKGKTNLKESLLAFEQLMQAKNRCTDEIRELRDKYSPNRAQRRAAQNGKGTMPFNGQNSGKPVYHGGKKQGSRN